MKKRIIVLNIILCLFGILSYGAGQTATTYSGFTYDDYSKVLTIKLSDGSSYKVDNLILSTEKYVLSEHEINEAYSLYKDTQNYFKELIGTSVVLKKSDQDLFNYELVMKSGKSLAEDLKEHTYAIASESISLSSGSAVIEQSNYFANRSTLANYIVLLGQAPKRKGEIEDALSRYEEEYGRDEAYCLLNGKRLVSELDLDSSNRYLLPKIEEDFLEVLNINPKLNDLYYLVATYYSWPFGKMLRKEIPRDYVAVNKYIKYMNIYFEKEKNVERAKYIRELIRLSNAYYLKGEMNKAYEYLTKGIKAREVHGILDKEKYAAEHIGKEVLEIVSLFDFMDEEPFEERVKLYRNNLEDIRIICRDMTSRKKTKIFGNILKAIKEGNVEFYEKENKDEIFSREIEEEYLSLRIYEAEKKISTLRVIKYTSLVALLITLAINVLLFVRQRKNRMTIAISLVLAVIFIAISSLGNLLKGNAKKYSGLLNSARQDKKVFDDRMKEEASDKELAIKIAKASALWIDDVIEKMKGDMSIIGWEAEEKGKNIYLVKYTYKNADQQMGWWFEVQFPSNIVRRVIGDAELERKYGLTRVDK